MVKFRIETFIIYLLKFILGKQNYIKFRFRLQNGYYLNIKNPQTFNEKIQIRKLYGNYKFYSYFADKVTMRDYVAKTIGKNYLIPTYGIYDNLTIDILKNLPNQFVIKSSHGSGKRFLNIIYNKKVINFYELCKKFNSAQKIDFGKRQDELFYSCQSPKILIEKLLIDENSQSPTDYKFHCFNNKNSFDYCLEVILNRFNKYEEVWMNSEWKQIKLLNKKNKYYGTQINKPQNLDEIIELIKILSKPFDYVRIDLYLYKNNIYVGEMTFAEGSGFYKIEPTETDYYLGNKWIMDKNTLINYSYIGKN